MKYRPGFPSKPFSSLEDAREWVAGFVAWYNEEHFHSGVGFVTPADRHSGRDIEILENRRTVYSRAARLRPNRWSRQPRQWDRPEIVLLNPQQGEATP